MQQPDTTDAARAGNAGGGCTAAVGQAGASGATGVPGSAVASVVLGVVGILTSFAVLPGLVCGAGAAWLAHVAAKQTGPDVGRPGRGYAVAGKATAGVALILSALVGGAFVLGSMGSWKHNRGRSGASSQLRGIHQALVTYSNSNKNHFPGLDPKGNILADSLNDTGLSGDGDTVEARYWIMLDGGFFTPEYAISPSENDSRVTEYDPGTGRHSNPVVWDNTTRHFSYAMLSIDGTPGRPPTAAGRAYEWTQTLNTNAIVVSDRNTGSNAMAGVQSIHTQTRGDWKGTVLWNDNHVGFEQGQYFETRYGTGSYRDPPTYTRDNLFEAAADDDAYMIHQGD